MKKKIAILGSTGSIGCNMLKIIEKLPVSQLRASGLLFALIGFVIVWYVRR